MIPTSSEPDGPSAVIFDLGGMVFRYRPDRRLDGFARITGLTPEDVRRRPIDSGYSRACDSGRPGRQAAHPVAPRRGAIGRALH